MSDLAAALDEAAQVEVEFHGAHIAWPDPIVFAAARERLRLSKIPCEATLSEPPPEGVDYVCPSCGGSGEVWADELIRTVAVMISGLPHFWPMMKPEIQQGFKDQARAVLDALDLYARGEAK